jgi:uncharacterized protein
MATFVLMYNYQKKYQMNKIIIDKTDELIKLCHLYSVKSMYAFGSVCTDKFNEESDIDLLISFEALTIEQYTDNYFDLHYQLEELFRRDIDLITDNSLSNPYFIQGVEQTKELIYAA